MRHTIEFYFDFSSAYSYIAQARLDESVGSFDSAAGFDLAVSWRPVLLGPVFQTLGTVPASPDTPKGRYLFRDVARCAREHGIPYRKPDIFPFSSVAAARLFYTLDRQCPSTAVIFAKAIFKSVYSEGRDIGAPETVADILSGILSGTGLKAEIDEDSKAALKTMTSHAQSLGIFGAPTFKVGEEIFWGADRLPQLVKWVTSGGW